MNLPFSLRKHGGNQRAETIKERQSGYHSVYCAKYAQFTDSVLLHISESLRRGRHGYAAQRLRLRLQCGTRCLTQKRPLSACKGRPTPFPFSKRSPVSGLRQAKKQREKGVKRVETVGVYPLALAAGRGTVPAVRRRQIPVYTQKAHTP